MPTDRRTTDRRLPPGTCTRCRHLRGDHFDGTGKCLTYQCDCPAFAVNTPPAPVRKATKARPPMRLKAATARKKK